jgi:hypothetical protein
MGQYLPDVRKVFKLIRTYKKDLETAVQVKPHVTVKYHPRAKKAGLR